MRAILGQLGHAVLLRLLDAGQHDLAVPGAVLELADQRADAALDHVVAQEHDEAVVAQEVLADLDRMGQAQRRLLRDEGHVDAPTAAAADGLAHLAGVVVHAHDDADLVDAGVADRLDHPEQHRLVGHRHQLLGAGVGQWIEARALCRRLESSLSCGFQSSSSDQ